MSLFVNKRITNLIKTFVTPQPTLSLLPLVTLLSQQNFMSNKKNKSTVFFISFTMKLKRALNI